MHRSFFRWAMALAAILMGVVSVRAQEAKSGDYIIDGFLEAFTKEGIKAWRPEVTVRQVATMGYCPEMVSVGVRLNKKFALGLGAGYNNFRNSFSIPFHMYKRTYFPIGTKDRFSLYSDVFLGYEYNYKVYGLDYDTGASTVQRGTDTIWLSWQPGIALRLIGKSNLFLGPSVYVPLKELSLPFIGLHLGLAL
ncbi:MAG: hypothetical protein J6Y61_05590 [Bacteroidales bacterium]|nr:hypothetical protein [Bacteroidales bacterium]